jgi:hypothetical protein
MDFFPTRKTNFKMMALKIGERARDEKTTHLFDVVYVNDPID